jgi:hypothetical protein
MGGIKDRSFLGWSGVVNDRGMQVRPEVLTPIWDPQSPLHHLHDASRYAADNPVLQRLAVTVRSGVVPGRLVVWQYGMLPKGHPVYAFLKRTYPIGSDKPYDGSPQPRLCIAAGNSRALCAQQANADPERAEFDPIRVPLDFRKRLTVQEAWTVFHLEQRDRQQNGFWQRLGIYRNYRETREAGELPGLMAEPAGALAVYAAFDQASDAVIDAFVAGKVSLLRVRQLVKLPIEQQGAALNAKPEKRQHGQGALSPLRLREAAERFKAEKGRKYSAAEVGALLEYAAGDRAVVLSGDVAALLGGKAK